jgi:OmcA/MtrC family decaheme c-type cytochrome
MEILEVTGAAPGGNVTVEFRITEDDGTFVDPSTLASCNLLMGGSTVDFAEYLRQDCRSATSAGGVSTKAFSAALPDDASGTWAMSADYYRNVTLNPGPTAALREAGYNPYYEFAVTDVSPVARRAVVDLTKCNTCHDVLALHGGQRYRVDECLICHNPNETDVSRRPADQAPPESVHLKYMIHKIHTGEENTNDLTIYGFGGTPHNYNEVLYPGDRRNCEACHVAGSYSLPLPEGTLPTLTQRDWYTPMQPAAAACISCHTSIDAAAHAYVNTAPFAEACAACHGEGREFDVAKVHAR